MNKSYNIYRQSVLRSIPLSSKDRALGFIDGSEIVWVALLAIRLCTLGFVVAGLTAHMRCIKIFAWEQWVSAGLFVTYLIAALGLALNAGTGKSLGHALHAYLTSTGSVFLGINSATIYRRWKNAKSMTKAVAELLTAVGLPLEKYLYAKVILSGLASGFFLMDLLITPLGPGYMNN